MSKLLATFTNIGWLLSCQLLVRTPHNHSQMTIKNNSVDLRLKVSGEEVTCTRVNGLSLDQSAQTFHVGSYEWVLVHITMTEGNWTGSDDVLIALGGCLEVHLNGVCVAKIDGLDLNIDSNNLTYVYTDQRNCCRKMGTDQGEKGFEHSLEMNLKSEFKLQLSGNTEYHENPEDDDFLEWGITDRSKQMLDPQKQDPDKLLREGVCALLSCLLSSSNEDLWHEENKLLACKSILLTMSCSEHASKIIMFCVNAIPSPNHSTIQTLINTLLKQKCILDDEETQLKLQEIIRTWLEEGNQVLKSYLQRIKQQWCKDHLPLISLILSIGNHEKNALILKHMTEYAPTRLDVMFNELFDATTIENHLFHPTVVSKFLDSVELTDFVYTMLKLIMTVSNHDNNVLIVTYLSDRSAHALVEEMILGLFPKDNVMEKYLTNTVAAGSDEDVLRHLQICHIVRGVHKKSYEVMLQIVVLRKQCDRDKLRKFIRVNATIDKIRQVQIFEEIDKLLPKDEVSEGIIPFFKNSPVKLLHILSLVVAAVDLTTDINMTTQFYQWNHTLSHNATYHYTLHAHNNTSVGKIAQLNTRLPFLFSFSVILLTEFMGICTAPFVITPKELKLWFGFDLHLPLKLIVYPIIGLLLPFFTGMYKLFVSMQARRFNDNFRKRKQLMAAKMNFQTEDWKGVLFEDIEMYGDDKLCEECKMIKITSNKGIRTDKKSKVCIFCGYFSTEAYNIYESQTMEIVTKWSGHHGRTKLISTAIEDTYMPILQVYIFFPEIMTYLNTGFTSGIGGMTFYDINSIFHIYSIFSSFVNIASGFTSTFFSMDGKFGLGKKICARVVYYLSAVLLISTRLLFLQVFAVTCLADSITPLYMCAILILHCVVVLIFKLIIYYWQFMVATNNITTRKFEHFLLILVSSLSSSFILTHLECNPQSDNDREDIIRKEQSRELRSMERIIFTALIITEQIVMTVLIFHFPPLTDTPIDQMLLALWIMYVVGLILEVVYHLFINPWSAISDRYNKKKYTFYLFLVLLTITAIVYTYIHEPDWRITMIFLVVSAVLFLLIISCNTISKKKLKMKKKTITKNGGLSELQSLLI